jgi:hypothetical protein
LLDEWFRFNVQVLRLFDDWSRFIEKIDQPLVAGNDFSICLGCASLRLETWPTSSMSQCPNMV